MLTFDHVGVHTGFSGSPGAQRLIGTTPYQADKPIAVTLDAAVHAGQTSAMTTSTPWLWLARQPGYGWQ